MTRPSLGVALVACCLISSGAAGAEENGATVLMPGALQISLQPGGGGLTIGVTTAFLENILEHEITAALEDVDHIDGVSTDARFLYEAGAERMPVSVKIDGRFAAGSLKVDFHCAARLALEVPRKPFREAAARLSGDAGGGKPIEKCGLGGDIGKELEGLLTGILNTGVKLLPDGSLWSRYIAKELDDPHGGDVLSRMYLIDRIKDGFEIGARFCQGDAGKSFCIEARWRKEDEERAIADALAQVPPSGPAAGPIPSDLITDWIERAPKYVHGDAIYPSKPDDDTDDMGIFGGLLCLSGYQDGCKMVSNAQTRSGAERGKWWRSPKHVGKPRAGPDEFSSDQTLGVMAFAVANLGSRDAQRQLRDWRRYIIRSAFTQPGYGSPVIRLARSCTHEDPGGTCNVMPGAWFLMNQVFERIEPGFKQAMDGSYGYDTRWLPFFAASNATGFRMHLIGVEILILKKLALDNEDTRLAARLLAGRQPENPFFLWLVHGSTEIVRTKTLHYCPAKGAESGASNQWSWERDMAAGDWKNSMRWECVFMAGLLRGG